MNKGTENIGSWLLVLFLLMAFTLPVKAEEQIHLFPDRNSAVSGDTIWFSLIIFSENVNEMSNVVHVQLDNLENNHISKVSVLCSGGTGTGYIPVPDSLSTGVYVLRAFSNIQKSDKSAVINQKFITVYNRFEEAFYRINMPEINSDKKYDLSDAIKIRTEKDKYERGENVKVGMDIQQEVADNTSQVIVTAGIEDSDFEIFATSWFPTGHKQVEKLPVSMVEKNGILIEGKVHSAETGQSVPNAVVVLSIPDSIPFFDYCVSDSLGMFYFYLRNATGTADLVLQALAKNSLPCTIELFENYVDVEGINSTEKMLNHEELVFAESAVKASYYTKFFKGYKVESGKYFTMQRQFKYPFYGEPSKTFNPNLFIDLPDFHEISREILRGVMYRERKKGTTIRLLNNGNGTVFKDEPLKLLDGIPVFDPKVLAPMGTTDIDKVDVVFYKRFFGDLSFDGVLSIYTKNRSLTWVDGNPSTGHFEYPCIQPQKMWNFSNTMVENTHIPNFNKVLYRLTSGGSNAPKTFSFKTSDLKGNVVVRVILVQKNRRILYRQKIIKVE